MKLSELFLGYREFYSESQIRDCITSSKNFISEKEDYNNAKLLLIFETLKQKTWLVTTEIRLYCVLDDIRKPSPNINWSLGKDKLISDNNIVLDIKSKDKNKTTGLVDLGSNHKNWLYSKRLFENYDIENSVKQLLINSIVDGENT